MSETQHREQDLSGVTLLGNQNTKYEFEYNPNLLERFKRHYDPLQEDEQIVNLDCFEFASRCKKTNQPDYGTVYISYIPGPEGWMVESKSTKLYLFSFQQHQDFHETCCHTIMEDLVKLLNPAYLSVFMDFNSRGGISILPYSIYADEAHQDLKKAMQVALMTEITHHTPRPRF